jgi:hypothetical protein
MTGPEHYLEAQRLIDRATKDRDYPETAFVMLAQVHATLAQTAALASGTMNRAEWFRATLTVPAEPDSGVMRT